MKKYLLVLMMGSLLLTACRKDEADQIDGPSLTDLYGTFGVVTPFAASSPTVDFGAGEAVHFTAEFEKQVDWEIRITGQTSGGVKVITGFGSTIDVSTSNWSGEITEFPVLQAEMCDVQLTFLNEPDVFTEQVEITSPKTNSGFLVSDFESGFNSGWTSFVQSGLNMDFQIKSDNFSPENGSYFNMAGEVDWDYLIGLVNFEAAAYGAPHYPLSTNANNEYFNIMLYGEPGLNNTIMLFQFTEDDNNDGTFTDSSEDMYSLEILIDWEGWRLVSIKYSDIPSLVNGQPAAPNGNGVHNPDKLTSVNMLHLANPATGFAQSKLDYMIFTQNGPLQP
ncbi:MAG: hypothetical protein AB8B56_02120 [Crocinitomicaceae bacterium]